MVEHSDQHSEGSNLTHYDLGSSEINKAVHDILKARKLLAKHAQHLSGEDNIANIQIGTGAHNIIHAEDSLMMQNYIEGDLDMVSGAHDIRNTNGTAMGGALERELDDLKGIINEYNNA